MKICPECGRELDDSARLCPLCGAAVPDMAADTPVPALGETLNELTNHAASHPEETPAEDSVPQVVSAFEEGTVGGVDTPPIEEVKPKRRAIVFVPIAIACAVVLGLAIWLTSGLLGGPDKEFLAGHKRLFEDMGKRELAPLARTIDAWANLDLDMTMTAEMDEGVEGGDEFDPVLKNMALNYRAKRDGDSVQVEAGFVWDGDTLLSGTLVYEKDGRLGFQVPQLSETYYVADYAALIENLTGAQIETSERTDFSSEAWAKTAETYGNILVSVVNGNNITKKTGTYPLYCINNDMKATAYTFRPTAKDLEVMLEQLADALEKDQDITTLVNGLTDDELAKLVDSIRTNGPEAAQEFADSGFAWTLRTSERDGVYQVEVVWDGGENSIRFERTWNSLYFSMVEDGEESGEQYFYYTGGEYEGEPCKGRFSVNGKTYLEFENVDLTKCSSMGLYYGGFTILNGEDAIATLNVASAAGGGTDHVLRLHPDTFGEDSSASHLSYILHTTDRPVTLTPPSGPVEDITNYTQEDFTALGETFSQNWNDVLMSLYMKLM